MSPEHSQPALTADELEASLRRIGSERYHDHHPFNLRMHAGTLTQREIQVWARNRYYYQTRIPLKDSLIIAKSADPAFRREWVQRIHDHDGAREGEGGLARWLHLSEAVGLDADEVAALGGGLIEQLQADMLPKIRDAALERIMPGARQVRIMATALGDDAGITGAAILAHDHT